MLAEPRPTGIRGFLIDAPSPGKLRGIRDGALLVERGCITACGDYDTVRSAHAGRDIRWMHSPEAVVIPGLIDIHTHLPQYPAVARHTEGRQPWLKKQIGPLERQFKAAASRTQSRAFYEELSRHGTTCAMLYSAVHPDSVEAAFSAAEETGMRIILGKMMAEAGAPLGSSKSIDQSCGECEILCRKWHGRADGRLEYAISPLSAASCSEELMRRAGKIAQKYNAYIQTHLAEHADETSTMSPNFPHRGDYTGVYDHCGLLGPRTVVAHCIHLTDAEIGQLARAGAAVAHCPTSNFFLTSGLMPMDRLQKAGLRIGLGTDVAGGPELNMWQIMRSAIEAQKARHFHDASIPIPGTADVFHLATRGGASALGKESLVGAFDIGMEADLVILDLAAVVPYGRKLNPHADLSAADVIAMLVYRGGPHAVVETFVRGRSIYRAPAPMLV